MELLHVPIYGLSELLSVSAWLIVGPPFWESTVLTVSVPGSVADTHRVQKWYKSLTSQTKHETES